MARSKDSKSRKKRQGDSKEGVALAWIVIAGIFGFMVWLYISIGNWSIQESVEDFRYEAASANHMLDSLKRFALATDNSFIVLPGKWVLDDLMGGTPYIQRIYPAGTDAHISAIERRIAANIVAMKPFSDQLIYIHDQEANHHLTPTQYGVLNRQHDQLLRQVLPLRHIHNDLIESMSNELYGLQNHAMAVYMEYGLPFWVVLFASIVGYLMKDPMKRKVKEENRKEAYRKVTAMKVKPIMGTIPNGYAMGDRPPISRRWQSSEFGQAIKAVWQKSGEDMPGIGGDIAGYLYVNRQWPASIDGHCGYDGGLLDHTANVTSAAVDLGIRNKWKGFKMQLLLLSAMAHDIGKVECFFFDDETGKWHSNGVYHDKVSGWLLQCMPHYMTMEKEHREALMLAVSNRHDKDGIPENAPAFSRTLRMMLTEADDVATRGELVGNDDWIEKAKDMAIEQWPGIMGRLNINGYFQGKSDGSFDDGQGCAFANQNRLLAAIYKHLPREVMGRIPFHALNNQSHPFWERLAPALIERGFILQEQMIPVRDERGEFHAQATLQAGALGFLPLRTRSGVHKDAVLLNTDFVPEAVLADWSITNNMDVDIRPLNDADIHPVEA